MFGPVPSVRGSVRNVAGIAKLARFRALRIVRKTYTIKVRLAIQRDSLLFLSRFSCSGAQLAYVFLEDTESAQLRTVRRGSGQAAAGPEVASQGSASNLDARRNRQEKWK